MMKTATAPALMATVVLMVIAGIYAVILPVTLGSFADAVQLDEGQLGLLVTSFMVGYAVSATSGFLWVERCRWRSLVVVSGLFLALTYIIPVWQPEYEVLLVCHLGSGAATGVIASVAVTSLAGASNPERAFATVYGSQSLAGAAALLWLPSGVEGYQPILYLLAALALMALLTIPFIPDKPPQAVQNTVTEARANSTPKWLIFIALGAVCVPFMAEMSAFSFLSEIARDKSLTREAAQQVIFYSMLISVFGSLLAGITGLRFGRLAPVILAFAMAAVAMVLLMMESSYLSYLLAVLLIYGGYNFSVPYRVSLVVSLDKSGRYAPLIITSQIMALMIGPGVSGLLIVGGGYSSAYWLWSALFVIGLVAYLGVAITARKTLTLNPLPQAHAGGRAEPGVESGDRQPQRL